MPSDNLSADPYAPTTWGAPTEFDFKCPSGQLCRIRRMDPLDLVAEGFLDSFDTLTSMVTNEHIANARMSPVERAKQQKELQDKAQQLLDGTADKQMLSGFTEMMSDPARSASFKKMLDRIIVKTVVRPEISPIPNEGFSRQEGVVYVDSIAFNDKLAIFNRAMGKVSELEPFRKGAPEPVGDMAPVESVQLPAEPATTD